MDVGGHLTLQLVPAVMHQHPETYIEPTGTNAVDYARDQAISEFGIATLRDRYLRKEEHSPQDAFMRSARAFSDDPAMANRMYSYFNRGWFMSSTPVLTNAPVRKTWSTEFTENFKPYHFGKSAGLPISCFLNEPDDSRVGLIEHYAEVAMLSSIGGGVGGYWGGIRSNGMATSSGSSSAGLMPFLSVIDREVLAFAQGNTRRASYAAFLDISHPEIVEFMEMRKGTGGDLNRKALNLHNGVCIPDAFMEIIERCMNDPDADDSWPLIDPKHGIVTEIVSAKALWVRLIELRAGAGQGEPYIVFSDTINRAMPEVQRAMGLRSKGSNLCVEISLATTRDRTAVCCLSSPNALLYDEWKNCPEFIRDITRFLDNVIQFFLEHAETYVRGEDRERIVKILREDLGYMLPPAEFKKVVDAVSANFANQIRRAINGAKAERPLGIGLMGFHSLLQSKGIPFESALATSVNRQIFAHIKNGFNLETRQLAKERGACPDAGPNGVVRNMYGLAVAPNASSSIFIPGESASPSCEPIAGNVFTHKTRSGTWSVENPQLKKVLAKYGRDDDATWRSITLQKGSVQHLAFLSDHERELFKTAKELDQHWVIEHAAHRQEFICQAASNNIFFAPGSHVSYLHSVHFMAWKRGVKTLYYLRTEEASQADSTGSGEGRIDIFAPEVDVGGVAAIRTVSRSQLAAASGGCISCE